MEPAVQFFSPPGLLSLINAGLSGLRGFKPRADQHSGSQNDMGVLITHNLRH